YWQNRGKQTVTVEETVTGFQTKLFRPSKASRYRLRRRTGMSALSFDWIARRFAPPTSPAGQQ
ncbi:hypothetical protein, partial [Klebsiella pneumoniae]|uniref:hypothetical protein n=1 Tax=Klebsiella pneumoniae TaxID=573 RepID=UPI00273019DC